MKILYIPLETPHDFQCETIHWGLRFLEKNGKIKVDKTFHNEKLYTKITENSHISPHYTYYRKWEEDIPTLNLNDINHKLKNKYYDLVIMQDGLNNAEYGYNKYKERIDEIYDIYQNNLFIIDGDDCGDKDYLKKLKNYKKLKYFRRELFHKSKYGLKNIFPINFGFPDELINDNEHQKTKLISSIIPGDGRTYIYTSENDYYNEYRNSKFAYTFSKCGWDCLRHLEIIFNKCLPIFLDLEFCPNYVLNFYPKFYLSEILNKICEIDYHNFNFENDIHTMGKNNYYKHVILQDLIKIKDMSYYEDIKKEIYEHSKKYLTCSSMIKYILEYYE